MKKHLLILVSVFAANMSFGQVLYDDYESSPTALTFATSSLFKDKVHNEGGYDLSATNPSATGLNTSAKVAKWERPSVAQYPYVGFSTKEKMSNPAAYASNDAGTPKITLLVYTNAPVGTLVSITLGSADDLDYPSGVYTLFEKATTVQNAWELITFDWHPTGVNGDSPFGGTEADEVDKVNFQIASGGTTAYDFYFDEFKGPELIVTGVKSASSLVADSKLYPNPTSGSTNIQLNLKSAANVKVVLNDIMGKELKVIAESNTNNLNESFDVTGLTKGIYSVTYLVDGVPAKTEKLIVK